MLQPKRTKYMRPQALRYEGNSKGNRFVAFGDYGILALEGAYVTDRQIEAARICLARYTRKLGKHYIRIYPHMIKTKKPAEVRMGSGKGSRDCYVAVVKRGCIMFEIGGISEVDAREALRLAGNKLPVSWKIVARAGLETKKEV
jgi:large subunit ribosomal protein L16